MRNLKVNNLPTKIGICLAVVCSLLLYSCNKTFDSEQELITYVLEESNGYVQHKTVNGVDFTLMYRPTDLLVNQELGDENPKKAEIDALRDKYGKYMYFNLSMSKNEKELLSVAPKNRNEFGAMVNQLAFGMHEKVHLFNQTKDTLELIDFIYPRMYGMSRSTTIMFVYPRDKEKLQNDILNFIIQDLGLYTGEVKFKIETEKINNEPQLLY